MNTFSKYFVGFFALFIGLVVGVLVSAAHVYIGTDTAIGAEAAVVAATGPSVDLKVNRSNGPVTVKYGSTPTVSWGSRGVTSCEAGLTEPDGTNIWKGSVATSGQVKITATTKSNVYLIKCQTAASTTISDAVVVYVPMPRSVLEAETPEFTILSASARTATAETGSTTMMAATYSVRIKPRVVSVNALNSSDVTMVANSSSSSIAVTVKSVTVEPSDSVLTDGTEYTATISGTVFPPQVPKTDTYTFTLKNIRWTRTDKFVSNYVPTGALVTTNPVTFVK